MKNFGEYIKQKRTERGYSLREFAKMVNIAPSYMSDIEKGRRYAPPKEKLNEILKHLLIDDPEEVSKFYDLAKTGKPVEIAEDVQEILKKDDSVAMLCRVIRDQNVNPQDIIDKLKEGKL